MDINYETNTLILTIYDEKNLYLVYNTLNEIERFLCKKLNVENENNELALFIDVDDYYEYQSLKRLIYNYCPIC